MRVTAAALAILAGVLLFQAGFLLRRRELGIRSECADVKALDGGECWTRKSVQRVLLVVIDALRFDFVAPAAEDDNDDDDKRSAARAPYRNQMPFLSSLVQKREALLTKFIADPPTTTLQRLKALVTGTLPTFIDASENFANDAKLADDNLVDQLSVLGRNVTMLGDDTWLSLFPTQFRRSFPFPSFDVHDLHTVDRGIVANLDDELARGDAQLVVAHFLGVDHAGHRFGPLHSELHAKLRELDRVLERVVLGRLTEDEGTMLIVLGDHGMTEQGEHGGDSKAETEAALVVWQKGRRFGEKTRSLERAVHQIDLVPTLAMLLDVPIPYSNLGLVIEELFPDEELRRHALVANFEQVKRFVKTYEQTEGVYIGGVESEARDDQAKRSAVLHVQRRLRALWTRFDERLMTIGLLALAEILLWSLSTESDGGSGISISDGVLRSGILLLSAAALLSSSSNSSVKDENAASRIAQSALEITLSICLLVHAIWTPVRLLFRENPGETVRNSWARRATRFLHVLLFLTQTVGFFSNSFVVAEARILRWTLQTVVVAGFIAKRVEALRKIGRRRWTIQTFFIGTTAEEKITAIVVLFGLFTIRLEPLSHRCREEEFSMQDDCLQTSLALPAQMAAASDAWWRALLGAVMVFGAAPIGFRRLRSIVSTEIRTNQGGVTATLVWPTAVLIFLHWALEALPADVAARYRNVSLLVAQAVYALSLIGITVLAVFPRRDRRLAVVELLQIASWPLLLLLGTALATPLGFLGVSCVAILLVIDRSDVWTRALALSTWSWLGFYTLAHQPVLATIPWQAAFIGVPGNVAWKAIPGGLVLAHIFAGHILVVLVALLEDGSELLEKLVWTSGLRVFAASAAAFLLRRHLMVWKIFAPRFVFESISFVVLLVTMVLARVVIGAAMRNNRTIRERK